MVDVAGWRLYHGRCELGIAVVSNTYPGMIARLREKPDGASSRLITLIVEGVRCGTVRRDWHRFAELIVACARVSRRCCGVVGDRRIGGVCAVGVPVKLRGKGVHCRARERRSRTCCSGR